MMMRMRAAAVVVQTYWADHVAMVVESAQRCSHELRDPQQQLMKSWMTWR